MEKQSLERHRVEQRPAWVASPAALLVSGLLLAGCATHLPPPPGLDVRGATVVAGTAAPTLDISGLPGGKAAGAGVGAGTGSGAGVVAGALGCLAAGPLYPLCLAVVIPTTAAIGAVTGAVLGAVKTESVDAMALKTRVVKEELASNGYQELLAGRVRERLAEAAPDAPASGGAGAVPRPAGESPWLVDVAVTEVGTEGKGEFALRLVARLAVHRPGETAMVYVVAKEVQSETELTTADWTAAEATALRGVMDVCVRRVADRLLLDLLAAPPPAVARSRPPARNPYSTSCDDVPAAWARAASAAS